MAEQTEANVERTIPYGVLSYSLSEAICAIGIPTLEMGLAAANAGLVKVSDGEGTIHFEWNKAKLDKHSVKFLEQMLISLRQAAGMQ